MIGVTRTLFDTKPKPVESVQMLLLFYQPCCHLPGTGRSIFSQPNQLDVLSFVGGGDLCLRVQLVLQCQLTRRRFPTGFFYHRLLVLFSRTGQLSQMLARDMVAIVCKVMLRLLLLLLLLLLLWICKRIRLSDPAGGREVAERGWGLQR